MAKEYFNLTFDRSDEHSWFLDEPQGLDGVPGDKFHFRSGRRHDCREPLVTRIIREGERHNFNFASLDVPIVSPNLAKVVRDVAPDDAEWIPVTLLPEMDSFEVLNVLRCIPCLDEEHSVFQKWGPSEEFPERSGNYRYVTELYIDPDRAQGHDVLRISGWLGPLIVSGEMKKALEDAGISGVEFLPAVWNQAE